MIEKQIYIDTPDGKKIFCAVDQVEESPSKKAVVIAHGLTGNPMEHMHMIARNYFVERGYDVYRLAFYWDGEDTRKLDECTVKIHAQDLSQILNMVKEKHPQVFCVGHSYGGLTLLLTNPNISALSFWDSSYVPEWFEEEYSQLKGTNYCVLPWGSHHLINPAMIQEAKDLDEVACKELAQNITTPSQIIIAQKTNTTPYRKDLYKHIKVDKELVEIEGADHCFYLGNSLQTLLDTTHKWFERF